MKNKVALDKKNRERYINHATKRGAEKILRLEGFFQKKNKILNSTGSLPRCRNFCIETGRGRGVSRFCQFARILLRRKFAEGNLLGWRKSSW